MALRAVAPQRQLCWGTFKLDAAQTSGLSAGSPVRFNTALAGGLSVAGEGFSLPAGGTFKLVASVRCRFNASGSAAFQWVVTSGTATVNGVNGIVLAARNTTATDGSQPLAYAVVTTTSASTVQLRIVAQTSLAGILPESVAEITEMPSEA